MDTDNPDGPETSIEERLIASFEPEAAEVEADEPVETAPETTEDEEQDPVEEPTDDLIDVEDDDGATHKVPAKLKDAFLRRADYTRKTQQAANLAEVAQDRLQYAEAREQFQQQILGEVAEIRAMQGQLKQLEALDLGTLYASDPGTALRVRDQRDDLRRQIQERESTVGNKARQWEGITQQHFSNQWKAAVDGAKARIGTFTPGEDAAMQKQAEAVGFTEKELKGRFADPRVLHLIYKAAKWDTLQANKGKAVETAKSAPPVLKPGALNANATASKEKALRAQFKKSGDYRDAAKLLLLKG